MRFVLEAEGTRGAIFVRTTIELVDLLLRAGLDEAAATRENYLEAGNLIEDAIPVARARNEHLEIAELLRLKWHMRFQLDELGGSARLLEESLAHLELGGAGEDRRSQIYHHLSHHHMLTGEFAKAISTIRHNVVYALDRGDEDALSTHYYSIGDAYLKTGQLDLARRYFEQSRVKFADPEHAYFNDALTKLSTIDRLVGDAERALTGHLQVHLYHRRRNNYRAIPAAIEAARDLIALGQLDRARQFAQEAFDDQRTLIEQRLDSSLLLLQIAIQEDDQGRAQAWITRIDQLIASMPDRSGSTLSTPLRQIQFAELAVTHFARDDNREQTIVRGERGLAIYHQLKSRIKSSGNDHMAWTSRSGPFISRYVAALYQLDQSRVIDVLESSYGLGPPANTGQPAKNNGNRNAVARLDELLAAEKAVVDAQSEWESQGGLAIRSMVDQARLRRDVARERYLLTDPSPMAVDRPMLRPGETRLTDIAPTDVFLRYYIGDEVSFVAVIEPGSATFFDLPTKRDVIELAEAASAALSSAGAAQTTGALSELRVLLPQQVIKRDQEQRIIVVADDVTHGIPFAAIDVSEPGARYMPLGAKKEVLRTYSIAAYGQRQPSRVLTPSGPEILVFGDPVFDPMDQTYANDDVLRSWGKSWTRLVHTANEVREIAELFPKDRTAVFLGPAATSAALMSPDAREATVLHIATHAYFNPETPDIVGLATSSVDVAGQQRRGFLSLAEILSKPFGNRLVVISGCQTMLGRQYSGLGVRSLSQGMIAQGAGAVIGTLWKIPDRPTAEFMRVFYRELLSERGDAGRALKNTRSLFSQSREYRRYADPHYWAAFALTSANRDVDRRVLQCVSCSQSTVQ